MFFKVPRSSASEDFFMNFRLLFEHFGSGAITVARGILGAFWNHFGLMLVTLWRPLAPFGFRWGAVAPLWHLGGTLLAYCNPVVVPKGHLWQHFAWILSKLFLCLAVCFQLVISEICFSTVFQRFSMDMSKKQFPKLVFQWSSMIFNSFHQCSKVFQWLSMEISQSQFSKVFIQCFKTIFNYLYKFSKVFKRVFNGNAQTKLLKLVFQWFPMAFNCFHRFSKAFQWFSMEAPPKHLPKLFFQWLSMIFDSFHKFSKVFHGFSMEI